MAYVNFYHSKTEEEALEASVQTGNTGKVYFSNDATTIVKNGVKYGSIAEDIKGLQAKDTSFIFQQVGGGLNTPSGLAQLTAMRGKNMVWNQIIFPEVRTTTSNGVTFMTKSDGTVTATGTATGGNAAWNQPTNVKSLHTYLIRGCPSGGSGRTYWVIDSNNVRDFDFGDGFIYTKNNTNSIICSIRIREGVTVDGLVFKPQVFDLTQMFGAGNEPSTVEEFEAMFPNEYYPYNTGSLLNFNAESLKTVGFNQWDEEWEKGYYDASGNPVSSTEQIRSKNLIKVIPNKEYYAKISTAHRFCYYDANGVFISRSDLISGENPLFTTPADCHYIKFHSDYTDTTYNHDICINISDPSKNGTYEPYWKSNLPLNIKTQTGKLNGSGNSVVVFPDGMAGMNGVQDTIQGNIAVKKFYQVNDLTTLPITLNYEGYSPEEEGGDTVYSFILELPKNGKAFTSAVMNGLFNKKYSASYGISTASSNNFYIYNLQGKSYVEIMDDDFSTDARFDDEEEWDALIADIRTSLADKVLMYELSSYENYTLDDMAMPLSYKIDKYGTEQIIPNSTDPDNAVPSTVPCDITAKYKLSYTEESQELFDNVSATQAQDFTNNQKNIARENIGIKANDIHLWDSSIFENMNLYSQAFYMDINKASSLGATRVDVGGNMDMRSLWEKSAVSVLMDENGNYCELNASDNRYTKEGDYLLNEDGTIVSAFAHCDFMKIIPLTYGRVQMVTENGSTFPRLWLSLVPLPGGYIIPQLVVGKFKASLVSNKLRSLPGMVPANSKTIRGFWESAQLRSKNHGLANLDFRNYLLFHMMSKYAWRDSQNCKGSDNTLIWGVGLDGTEGLASGETVGNNGFTNQRYVHTGETLSLGDYDGKVAVTLPNGKKAHSINVAGFGDPWGQYWEMMGGLCSVGTDVYCWRSNIVPASAPTAETFQGIEHVLLTRPASAVWGMNIIASENGQGVYMIPKQSLSGVNYGDNFWYAETGQLWLFGGASLNGSACGLASAASTYAWTYSAAGYSARLAYYGSLNKVSATKMKELGTPTQN